VSFLTDEAVAQRATAEVAYAPAAAEGIDLSRARARRVFHAALAASLQTSGDRTAEEMQGLLGWFHLRYTNNELQSVLDSAASFYPKVISAPKRGDLADAATRKRNPVIGNVELTEAGQKMRAPRGASLTDLGSIGVRSTVLMWSGAEGAGKIAKALV
jgi:hypothetical protein